MGVFGLWVLSMLFSMGGLIVWVLRVGLAMGLSVGLGLRYRLL